MNSKTPLKIALAQVNPTVGAIDANAEMIIEWSGRARDNGADLIIFPELMLTGYPPEDLLFRRQFIQQAAAALEWIRQNNPGLCIVLGTVHQVHDCLFNVAAVLQPDAPILWYYKQQLPNYGVFDERRYFIPGRQALVFSVNGTRVGVTVCEDIWHPDPVRQAVDEGADFIISLNASPYHQSKSDERYEQVSLRVAENKVPVCYVNLVGGQDELVFDGHSFVMDTGQKACLTMPGFEAALGFVEFRDGEMQGFGESEQEKEPLAQLYSALVLATRDYVTKNGFEKVVLGLSGGIDSAMVLAIAVDALGADAVQAVMMPYHYTSDISKTDAAEQAGMLGIRLSEIAISEPVQAFMQVLDSEFSGLGQDVTEENLQARSRGVILMAISNKKAAMLLTTGNKSEMSVGYATLYGDMAGGFAPLKDVSKLNVYALARYRNSLSPAIPQRVIDRPPSAELAPDQKDEDSLPAYEVLDPILEMYVEQDLSVEEIIQSGYEAEDVRRVAWLVDVNEYKRRQSPPGVRVTRRAFGKERRYPITSGFNRNR